MASYGRSSLPFAGPSRLKTLKTLTTLQNPLATSNTAGTSYPKARLLMGVQACRLRAFQRFKRFKMVLARSTPQAQATPRPHQWLLMGVQACG